MFHRSILPKLALCLALAAAGACEARPASLAGCPATRAELDAVLKTWVVRSGSARKAGAPVVYAVNGIEVFAAKPLKLQADFDPKLLDTLAVTLPGKVSQYRGRFLRYFNAQEAKLGAPAEMNCPKQSVCHRLSQYEGKQRLRVGALAIAAIQDRGEGVLLECKYRSH